PCHGPRTLPGRYGRCAFRWNSKIRPSDDDGADAVTGRLKFSGGKTAREKFETIVFFCYDCDDDLAKYNREKDLKWTRSRFLYHCCKRCKESRISRRWH